MQLTSRLLRSKATIVAMIAASVSLVALLLTLHPSVARGATAQSQTVTVDGKTAVVTAVGPNELRITVDGEEWTYRRDGRGSSILGPLDGKVDPMLISAVVDQLGADVRPGSTRQSSPGQGLFGLLLMAIGAVNLAWPRAAWYLSDGWKFRDAEPSEMALVMARLGGVIALLAGFAFLFA